MRSHTHAHMQKTLAEPEPISERYIWSEAL